jgi:hypothetical protein
VRCDDGWIWGVGGSILSWNKLHGTCQWPVHAEPEVGGTRETTPTSRFWATPLGARLVLRLFFNLTKRQPKSPIGSVPDSCYLDTGHVVPGHQ